MSYPTKITNFVKTASSQKLGLLSKYLTNPTKYSNSLPIIGEDVVLSFLSIDWPPDCPDSISIKLQWIKQDITQHPVCPNCGKPSKWLASLTKYQTYCNAKCATSHKNPASRSVGEFKSIKEAIEKTGKSYWKITKQLKDEKTIKKLKENEFLLNKEFLLKQKEKRIPIYQIADSLNVKSELVSLAFNFHEIDTKFDQLPLETKQWLTKENLESFAKSDENVPQLAKKLGCSPSLILQLLNKYQIDYNPQNSSLPQAEVGEFLSSLGVEFHKNTRKIISPKELDFYIPEFKIAIEFNGLFWHADDKILPMKHQEKWKLCREKGIQLIQIFEDDWIFKNELVKRKLKHLLKKSDCEKVYARNCIPIILSNKDVKQFYEQNHLQGHKNSKEVFGLLHRGNLVAALSFNDHKLERFATSCHVVGGFSKLLKFANKKYVETFADLCWTNVENNVYVVNGFALTSITKPGYFWIVNGKRQSRVKFQKHKLKHFVNYSDDKTEDQIMKENGYLKIFDAGHAKFILKNN